MYFVAKCSKKYNNAIKHTLQFTIFDDKETCQFCTYDVVKVTYNPYYHQFWMDLNAVFCAKSKILQNTTSQ